MSPTASMAKHTLFAQAENQVGQAAWRFIRNGLKDLTGRPAETRVDVLELLWNKHSASAASGAFIGDELVITARGPGLREALEAALEKHLRGIQEGAANLYFHELPLPYLGVQIPDEVETAIIKKVGGGRKSVEPKEKDRTGNPLQYAYDMAIANQQRAEQRLVLLMHFAHYLRGAHRSTLPLAAAELEFQKAYEALWAQRGTHRAQARDMAILLGGAALKAAVADIKRNYGEGMSVMHLLERDGVLPGRHLRADEETVRAAIQGA